MTARFLFGMPNGSRLSSPTNEVERPFESSAKSFTRIAPMCARGQEVASSRRSAENAPNPTHGQAQPSPPTAGRAEGPSISPPAWESEGSSSPPDGGETSAPRRIGRPAADRGQVAIRVGARARIRRARGGRSAEVVLHGAVPVHEWVPAPRLRNVVPAGRVPVSIPADAGVQRPPPAGVSLHRPADPGSGEADRGERAEAVGDPSGDGHPRPRDPEIRGPDALDRGLPRRDDGGPEGARRGRRLDAFLHHDTAQPALRRIRALAVPPPQGRRLRADRQAPGHLVPEGPGADGGPRSP